MAFSSTIKATLGLDSKPFEIGLQRANGALSGLKRTAQKFDFGRGVTGLFGVGAIVQGFSSVLDKAQAIRDEAEKLGRPVDAATASVARYADAWDQVKDSIGQVAVQAMGAVTQAGESIGVGIARLKGALEGRSAEDVDATIAHNEQAEANIARMQADLARGGPAERGALKREQQAEKDKRDTEIIARSFERAAKIREQIAERQRSDEQQLLYLQERRSEAQRAYDDNAASSSDRAGALVRLAELDLRIAEKREKIDTRISEEKEKQRRTQAQLLENQKSQREELDKTLSVAEKSRDRAVSDYARANRDRVAFTLAEAASGERGNPAEQRTAKQIRKLEADARRAYDSTSTSSYFDAATQKTVVETGEQRSARLLIEAGALRDKMAPRLHSSDSDPMKAYQDAIKTSESYLKEIRDSLRPERTS